MQGWTYTINTNIHLIVKRLNSMGNSATDHGNIVYLPKLVFVTRQPGIL